MVGEANAALLDEAKACADRAAAGANRFYWIAGLSLLNSVILLFGGNLRFVVGLGMTSIVDGMLSAAHIPTVTVLGLFINLLIAGVYVVFGIFGTRRQTWAFLVGMIFYLLDGLIFLIGPDFLSLAFHAYFLFALFKGYQACTRYHAIQQQLGPIHTNLPPPSQGSTFKFN